MEKVKIGNLCLDASHATMGEQYVLDSACACAVTSP